MLLVVTRIGESEGKGELPGVESAKKRTTKKTTNSAKAAGRNSLTTVFRPRGNEVTTHRSNTIAASLCRKPIATKARKSSKSILMSVSAFTALSTLNDSRVDRIRIGRDLGLRFVSPNAKMGR